MYRFEVLTEDAIDEIAVFSMENFQERFCDILNYKQQEAYYNHRYSPHAISSDSEEGIDYYFIERDGVKVGYISFYVEDCEDGERLEISDFYLRKDERNEQAARSVVRFAAMVACENDVGDIELFIDDNEYYCISFFEKLGFEVECRKGKIVCDLNVEIEGYALTKKISVARTVLLYIEREDEYLLIHRTKKDMNYGKYMGVGGHIERGETPRRAAVREAFEESGLNVEKLIYCGKLYFYFDCNANQVELSYLYKSDKFSGELKKECSEGELLWVKKNDVLDLDVWAGDKIFLPKMENGERFELDLFFEKEELKEYNFRR